MIEAYEEESVSPFMRRIRFRNKLWVVVMDHAVHNGFKTAMLNLCSMDTTQECLMRTNWMSSLKRVLGVDNVVSETEWSTYLRRIHESRQAEDEEET
jgi:hypothetical protein